MGTQHSTENIIRDQGKTTTGIPRHAPMTENQQQQRKGNNPRNARFNQNNSYPSRNQYQLNRSTNEVNHQTETIIDGDTMEVFINRTTASNITIRTLIINRYSSLSKKLPYIKIAFSSNCRAEQTSLCIWSYSVTVTSAQLCCAKCHRRGYPR